MNSQANNEHSLANEVGINAAEQATRKAFIEFSPRDEKLLKELRTVIKANADRIVDGFYNNVERYSQLLAIIESAGSSVERLRAAQKQYLIELFDGDYGESYVERRLKIGVVHNRIGLTPAWYLGSYSTYYQLIVPLIQRRYRFRPGKATRAILALNKILSFDSQLAIETYIHAVMQDLKDVSMSKGDIEQTVISYKTFIEKVAQGDLSQRVEVHGEDDLSQLGTQLNSMTENLAVMARLTTTASDTLTETISGMMGAVSSHSSAAVEQAAAVNETTSTLEEIRAISAQTQEKAEALGSSADRTQAEGEKGLQVVEQTVSGMESIRTKVEGIAENILALSEQTQQIGEITDTVNNLSHQLKMLALNASIEAAKAGEAGKGFAVVAAEVKDLAEQSQQATEQVHKILQDIQRATDKAVMVTEEGGKGVDQGMVLVNESGDAMRELTEVIRETAMASQQIVVSVRQEAQGIDQIFSAMQEINRATTQFLEATNQSKSAGEKLSDVAAEMRKSILSYRV